jgi:hypothetical protein
MLIFIVSNDVNPCGKLEGRSLEEIKSLGRPEK